MHAASRTLSLRCSGLAAVAAVAVAAAAAAAVAVAAERLWQLQGPQTSFVLAAVAFGVVDIASPLPGGLELGEKDFEASYLVGRFGPEYQECYPPSSEAYPCSTLVVPNRNHDPG